LKLLNDENVGPDGCNGYYMDIMNVRSMSKVLFLGPDGRNMLLGKLIPALLEIQMWCRHPEVIH